MTFITRNIDDAFNLIPNSLPETLIPHDAKRNDAEILASGFFINYFHLNKDFVCARSTINLETGPWTIQTRGQLDVSLYIVQQRFDEYVMNHDDAETDITQQTIDGAEKANQKAIKEGKTHEGI